MAVHTQHTSPAAIDPPCGEYCCHATNWPISAASLDALVDLGLSNACIARYYRVTVDDVFALVRRQGVSRQAVGE